ncbi:MAG: TadE/TadG family type IV pilus assembly protein [Pseudomonadota bacterium]
MTSINLSQALKRRTRDRFEALQEDKEGLAAVEFALIAVPFFTLLFGIIEVCLLFTANTVLDHAINEAARDIRTGKIQASGSPESTFRTAVCDEITVLLTCDADRLFVDADEFDDFTSVSLAQPTWNGSSLDGLAPFNPGADDKIVVVRGFYRWTLFTPIISQPLVNIDTSDHLLQATVAFRNEPF